MVHLRSLTVLWTPCSLVSYPEDNRDGRRNTSVMNTVRQTHFTLRTSVGLTECLDISDKCTGIGGGGALVAQWLRCCTTKRKAAGSIPAGVIGFFIDIKSFRSHYGPGVDLAYTRNEYQEYFLAVNAAGA